MKIADSNIQMSASHSKTQVHVKHESLQMWVDGEQPRPGTPGNGRVPPGHAFGLALRAGRMEISAEAQALQAKQAQLSEEDEPEMTPMDDLNVAIVKELVKRLTGREFKLFDPSEMSGKAGGDAPAEASAKGGTPSAEGAPEREGWGLVYDYYEAHHESESTRFSADGVIRTADGREIEFAVDLQMSRSFTSEERISLRAGDALKDPLVVNFSGTAAELTQTKFSFDLDADGREEQIAFVAPGSGFLALDRNGDGVVNDGSELFGPSTNDGFAELAAHDSDGNGWIDEADPIYSGLRIWSKDASGNDHLIGLGQANVGAIYLGHIGTPFELKDAENQLQGAVRSSGLYLSEEGRVGTVQQLDLKV